METTVGMMKNLSQYQFDFILFTGNVRFNLLRGFLPRHYHPVYLCIGDIPAHNVWNQSPIDQIDVIQTWTNLFTTYFPGNYSTHCQRFEVYNGLCYV